MEKNKKKAKRFRIKTTKKIVLLSIFFLLIFITSGCVSYYKYPTPTDLPSKMFVRVEGTLESYSKNVDMNRHKSVGLYGIEVLIHCDYSKHPNYNEWVTKYNLKETYSDASEKFSDHYFYKLNNACYEQIKDGFPLGEFTALGISEDLYFFYKARENYEESMRQSIDNFNKMKQIFYNSKDFETLKELSKQSFVVYIRIAEHEPNYESYDD